MIFVEEDEEDAVHGIGDEVAVEEARYVENYVLQM